jgi:hypothetical protein
MANDKEIIKRLFAVVQKQQKIITKLAQSADPFAATGLPGDPLDPTLPGDSPTPAAKPAPAPAAKPAPAPSGQGGLPAEVKSALDNAGLPQLKGNLLVTVNGRGLNIAFNADRVKDRPTDLKNKLNSALGGGYTVTDVMGHMNPAWKANY